MPQVQAKWTSKLRSIYFISPFMRHQLPYSTNQLPLTLHEKNPTDCSIRWILIQTNKTKVIVPSLMKSEVLGWHHLIQTTLPFLSHCTHALLFLDNLLPLSVPLINWGVWVSLFKVPYNPVVTHPQSSLGWKHNKEQDKQQLICTCSNFFQIAS